MTKKSFIVCVDSDGCAMDTMTVKHVKCFGPRIIQIWGLQQWQEELLTFWNDINLYRSSRGINRFSGLSKFLQTVNEKYTPVEGLETFTKWCKQTPAYSEKELLSAIVGGQNSDCMQKALAWSRQVNQDIVALPNEVKTAFQGVKEAFALIKREADIAIVSSANPAAVQEEWERCRLLEMVDYVCAQDVGTKTACIAKLLSLGYERENVIMLGDAFGDLTAAEANGVNFYPILAGKEEESWKSFVTTAFPAFLRGEYFGKMQAQQKQLLLEHLPE